MTTTLPAGGPVLPTLENDFGSVNHLPLHHSGAPGALEVEDKRDILHQEISHPSNVDGLLPAYLSYDARQTARAFYRAITFCVLVAMGAMYDAYVTSVPQNLLANEGFILRMSTLTVNGVPTIDPTAITIWSVMYVLGSIFTMWFSPAISDRFGRKIILYLLTIALVLDPTIGILAKDWGTYCAARWFSGMAAGFLQTGVNNYISEVAPTKVRGAMILLYAIMFAVGGLLGTVMLNEVANYAPLNYKIAFYTEYGVLAIFLPGVILAPESPMWAARRGNESKAKKSMRWLYGTEASYDVDTEYQKLLLVVEMERQEQSKAGGWRQYLECFKGTNLRRTVISFIPLVLQQMSGLILYLGYSAYFFSLVGYAKPFQAGVIIQSVLLFFVLLSFVIVDKVGRRPLLLGGLFIIVLCNFTLGGISFLPKANGAAMIFLMCVWAAAYSLSIGPLAWAYVAETATGTLRAKTIGLATGGVQAFNLIWSYSIPIILSPTKDNWGMKSAFLFGGLSTLGLVACYFLVPETKARTFAELDELFEKRVPARHFANYKTQVQLEVESSAMTGKDVEA